MASQPIPLIPSSPSSFKRSVIIRQWLVLQMLAANTAEFSAELETERVLAFAAACEAVGDGRVQLDYEPRDTEVLEMPAAGEKLYLQAVLYWCTRLRCSAGRLVEAHARLGSRPPVERVMAAIATLDKADVGGDSWTHTSKTFAVSSQPPNFRTTVPI